MHRFGNLRAPDGLCGRAAAQLIDMSTLLRACIVILFLLVAACGACAQSGAASVTLTGRVSGALALSATEARALGGRAQVSTATVDANTIAVSLSGSADGETRVSIPLRLRSNVGYSLRASFLSPAELTVRLSLADARATGKLVHANALAGIRLDAALADARGDARSERASFLPVQNPSRQFAILSGPPVSKAGTFSSPDNAIEIVLSVEVRPRDNKESWSTQLTITAAPNTPAGR